VSLNVNWWNKLEMGKDTNPKNIRMRKYSNIRPVKCLFGLYFGIHFPSGVRVRFVRNYRQVCLILKLDCYSCYLFPQIVHGSYTYMICHMKLTLEILCVSKEKVEAESFLCWHKVPKT
jgi:hypothetical protein